MKPLKASGYRSTQTFEDFFNFLVLFALVDPVSGTVLGFWQSNAAVVTT
jgi:hypothetical protein